MQPPELEKPPAGTDGSKLTSAYDSREVQAPSYGGEPKRASHPVVYRFDSKDSPEDRALLRVCREVRDQPQRLPLAAHRLGGLVNAGRLPYRRTWDALYDAALGAGASEAWVLRCLYAGFAESNVSELPSPTLWDLVNGGVQ